MLLGSRLQVWILSGTGDSSREKLATEFAEQRKGGHTDLRLSSPFIVLTLFSTSGFYGLKKWMVEILLSKVGQTTYQPVQCRIPVSTKLSEYCPYSKYPLFLGYDADPLLKKEVFTMETQVFKKIP